MDKRSFRLWSFVVVAFCLVVGISGYFVNQNARIHRQADVKQTQITRDATVETTKIKQDKKTERSKERWASLPFMRDKKE